MSQLALLPRHLQERSLSRSEIILPMSEALEAIDLFESQGVQILGWEGLARDPQGRLGHGSAPQGTVSLEHLSIRDAARLCRETIARDAAQWAQNNPGSTDELHFCIVVRA